MTPEEREERRKEQNRRALRKYRQTAKGKANAREYMREYRQRPGAGDRMREYDRRRSKRPARRESQRKSERKYHKRTYIPRPSRDPDNPLDLDSLHFVGYRKHLPAKVEEQGGLCAHPACGKELCADATIDHKVPRVLAKQHGWTQEQMDHPSNLQVMCSSCNKSKGAAYTGPIPPIPHSDNRPVQLSLSL